MKATTFGWGRAFGSALLLAFLGTGTASAQSAAEEDSLYERLGGLPAISVVVSDFIDDFVGDEVIMANPAVRERKTPAEAPYIKFQVTTLVCEVTGGPCQYTGLSLREAHEGLNVSDEEWDRMGQIFGRTLEAHGVPEQEQQELFAILGGTKPDIVTGGG